MKPTSLKVKMQSIIIPLSSEMKKSILILIGFLINLSFCIAQNQDKVSGHIIDSLTKKPIEFVNVVLLNADSAFVCGAVTDSLGYYELSKNLVEGKTYTIQVTHVCYDRKRVSFCHGEQTDVSIELTANATSLDEVVVNGIKTLVSTKYF